MDPARDVKSTRQLYLGAGFHEGLSLERVGSSAETLEPHVSANGRRSIRIGASPVQVGVLRDPRLLCSPEVRAPCFPWSRACLVLTLAHLR
jgi:hypothetical protein